MYYTFFFNVDAVVCQNNGQFQVCELNICQFIVIVEIKYFLNLNEYDFPIFILLIHFRHISFFYITKDIQSNNNNNNVLSMLFAEICPKVRRHNALPFRVPSRALCLLTLGHISAYSMDNTIVLYNDYMTQLCDTTIWHYYMTLLCDTTMWHYHLTLLYDTTMWHYHMTLLCDTIMWHYYVTLLCDTTIWHYYMTLLCDTTIWHYYVTLLCDTTMW
jgi:hypothetical protein